MSFLDTLFRPIFEVMAGLIAFYFGLVHNYAVAIGMLTITVMIVLSPLTIISTRSMLQMQKVQPELKKIQQKLRGDKQALMQAQQALFKENNVSPASGCLPMLLQFPLLIVMYQVIRGLTNTVGKTHIVAPKYIGHSTQLYKSLIDGHGTMNSLGINLAESATSHHSSFFVAIPYFLMVLIAVGLQFFQTWQITSKNPAAAKANPQAYNIQRYTPLIFGFIYIGIPAGVNLYFAVSGLFRVVQQEVMWRHDPVLRAHSQEQKEAKNAPPGPVADGFVDKEAQRENKRSTKPPLKSSGSNATSKRPIAPSGRQTPKGNGKASSPSWGRSGPAYLRQNDKKKRGPSK